jgi:hypothetical protein
VQNEVAMVRAVAIGLAVLTLAVAFSKDLAHLRPDLWGAHVSQHRQPSELGDSLAQEIDTFAGDIDRWIREASDSDGRGSKTISKVQTMRRETSSYGSRMR